MSALSQALLDAVCELAAKLPLATLSELRALLRGLMGESVTDLERRAALLLHHDNRPFAANLFNMREKESSAVSARELAAALEAAGRQDALIKARSSIELVWTGPPAPGAGLRNTEQVQYRQD